MPIDTWIMAKYSEVLGEGMRSPSNYFEQVRRSVDGNPLNIFATVNNLFSLGAPSSEIHASLEGELLSDSVRNKLERLRRRHSPAPPLVTFTRAGALLNLKLLFAVTRPTKSYKPTAVGACALHANDYVESDETSSLRSGLLPVITEFAATWEIQNPRDPAPLLRRSYFIYDMLLTKDERIEDLIHKELGVGIEGVDFAGLAFTSFFPLLFGLYAVARSGVERDRTSVVDAHDVAAKAGITPEEFIAFAASKARTLDEARAEFGPIETAADLATRVENPVWAVETMSFRDKPLLLLPDGRYMVLDIQFLFENASSGLFWNFMRRLESSRARENFSSYWGNLFERYVQQLVKHYLGDAVTCNVEFDGGEIDILLDLPDAMVAMEVKSGFIAQDVKCSRDQSRFAAAIMKKYVVDQDGRQKGVRQLAACARALCEKRVRGDVSTFKRIYPVLVAEDPVMQTFAMNAYLNEIFVKEIDLGTDIAPLTVLLVDELEELLPHIATNDFSWRDVLEARFVDQKVVAAPMHTTFSEVAGERNLNQRADTFLAAHGGELMTMIETAYREFFASGEGSEARK